MDEFECPKLMDGVETAVMTQACEKNLRTSRTGGVMSLQI